MSRNLDNLDFMESLQNFYGLAKTPNENYDTFLKRLMEAWDACKISEDVTLRERVIDNITDLELKEQISKVGNISSRKVMALCRSFDEIGLKEFKDDEQESCFEISELALSYIDPQLKIHLKKFIENNQEFLNKFTRNSDRMAENLLTNYRFIDDWREIIMNDVKEAFQDKYPNDITVLSLGTNIYGACESLDVHLELVNTSDMQRCILIFDQCKKFKLIIKKNYTIFVMHCKSGITCNIQFENTKGTVKANIDGIIKLYSQNEKYKKFVAILLLWFENISGKANDAYHSNFIVFKIFWRFIEDHQIGNNFTYKRHLVPFFQYINSMTYYRAVPVNPLYALICVKDNGLFCSEIYRLKEFLEVSTVLMEYIN